ncbi:MAG: Hsp20/alpha crystallin family protein [Candidatus Zixiibacteriota bacterium]
MTYLTVRPRRDPWTTEIDNWFEDFFHWPIRMRDHQDGFLPRVNVAETNDEVRLTFELPGMDKKDIKVTVQDGVLTVSGKRELKNESKGDSVVRREIRSGEFSRSFTIPDTVNSDKIAADYTNGLLEIRLAKLEEVKPKEIEVKVS